MGKPINTRNKEPYQNIFRALTTKKKKKSKWNEKQFNKHVNYKSFAENKTLFIYQKHVDKVQYFSFFSTAVNASPT